MFDCQGLSSNLKSRIILCPSKDCVPMNRDRGNLAESLYSCRLSARSDPRHGAKMLQSSRPCYSCSLSRISLCVLHYIVLCHLLDPSLHLRSSVQFFLSSERFHLSISGCVQHVHCHQGVCLLRLTIRNKARMRQLHVPLSILLNVCSRREECLGPSCWTYSSMAGAHIPKETKGAETF